ncbi:MAG: phage tail protein [Pseudomonadaceae bacterium]|nr:phage tail protein [Pseudomonadaceae bacterium]
MAVSLSNGSVVSVAASYGAAITISAITNANPAVATTSAAHGLANGDFVEVTSGWSKLNSRIVRVAAASGSVFTLEGFDTSSVSLFPSGGGTGTCKKIATWTQITQMLDLTTAGGEQQFVNYSFLEQDFESQIPTLKSASSMTLSIGDDSTLPHYAILSAANDDRVPRALRLVLPNGAILLYNGYMTLNKTPSLTKSQIMALAATVSMTSQPVRYAA